MCSEKVHSGQFDVVQRLVNENTWCTLYMLREISRSNICNCYEPLMLYLNVTTNLTGSFRISIVAVRFEENKKSGSFINSYCIYLQVLLLSERCTKLAILLNLSL